MAFDRPIEADSVDDLGLLSSLIRAPVLGIMWLLGGDHSKDPEEEETLKQEKERMEREMSGNTEGDGEGGGLEVNGCADSHADSLSSDGSRDRGQAGTNDDDPPRVSSSAMSNEHVNQADDVKGHDKENKEPPLENWPSVGYLDSSSKEDLSSTCKSKHDNDAAKKNSAGPRSLGQSSLREKCPATQIIDDLVNVMESNHISNPANSGSHGPATSAVLSSQGKMTSSSTNSLSASYSASTFSHPHSTSQTLSLHSSMRGSKKMSWSDECGNRSLVEYFDESPRSKHWSSMRRNSWTASRHSFDGGDRGARTRRSDSRVIKSALKRSGSYSPPVALYANNSRGLSASTSSSTGSSSSSPQLKSFRSISVIGSSDSSRSNSSDHLGQESTHSHDTDDSMAGVTNKKLNSNDVQCVPSTLQAGCGLANGGLIIPRGGPADPRYYYPRGGPNDPRYQLVLGTQQGESKNEQDEGGSAEDVNPPNPPKHYITGGRSSPGHHHHFLPRHHTNGYASPQYGFYVNITPPTPELYAANRKTLKPADKSFRSAMQQQSHQDFQYQNKYPAPSPIPEGSPGGTQGIPQRFVGRSSVPRPTSNRSSGERDQLSAARQNSLKPTFTKNKKGMGMILAENPHHGVWPTVPFG